jgi:hypothetical protein
MGIIVITVVTQGLLAPPEIRGSLDRSILFINDGVFQSIGVISFGAQTSRFPRFPGLLFHPDSSCLPLFPIYLPLVFPERQNMLTAEDPILSIRMPPQLHPDLQLD